MPQRVNVTLTDDAYKTLQEMSKASGQDMSDFIRNSLRVYHTIKEETGKGRSIYVGKNDRADKELLIP